MKNILLFGSLILAFTLLTGCSEPKPHNPAFELGKPFTLAQGNTMQTADNALVIQFDKVSGDSRCPEGTQCIWAGRADGIFTLSKGETVEAVTLSTGDFGQGGSSQASFEGYTVTLKNMAPPKSASAEIAQKDYIATLEVTR